MLLNLYIFGIVFMGKSLPSTTRLQEFTRIITSDKLRKPKRTKPISQIPVSSPEIAISDRVRAESERLKLRMESHEGQSRIPLAQVVVDCVNRWFQDTLKEAKAGDSAMQVLVGQMYYSGYGVPRDPQKVHYFSPFRFPFFVFFLGFSEFFCFVGSFHLWMCGIMNITGFKIFKVLFFWGLWE